MTKPKRVQPPRERYVAQTKNHVFDKHNGEIVLITRDGDAIVLARVMNVADRRAALPASGERERA